MFKNDNKIYHYEALVKFVDENAWEIFGTLNMYLGR